MAGRRGPARNEVDIRERVFDHTRHTAHGRGLRSFMGGGSGVDLRVQTFVGEAVAASWCIDGFGRNGAAITRNVAHLQDYTGWGALRVTASISSRSTVKSNTIWIASPGFLFSL